MDYVSEPQPSGASATTPRKHGRPSKREAVNNGASSALSITNEALRRSTRRNRRSTESDSDPKSSDPSQTFGIENDSDTDGEYQPSEETKRAIAGTEADGALTDSDVVHAGESTALAMFLAFAGGLGQLASGVLGAGVSGPRE